MADAFSDGKVIRLFATHRAFAAVKRHLAYHGIYRDLVWFGGRWDKGDKVSWFAAHLLWVRIGQDIDSSYQDHWYPHDIHVLHHARQIIRPLFWTARNSFQQPKEMETSLRGELPDAVAILERKYPGSDSFAFRFELYKAMVFKSWVLKDYVHLMAWSSQMPLHEFYWSLCTTQRLSPFKSHVTSCSVLAGRNNIQPLNSRILSSNDSGFVDWIAQNGQIHANPFHENARQILFAFSNIYSDHSDPRICCRWKVCKHVKQMSVEMLGNKCLLPDMLLGYLVEIPWPLLRCLKL